MTVSAVTRASGWDPAYLPGNLAIQPRPHRNGTVPEGKSAQPRMANDSYTPGAITSASNSIQAPAITTNNAANPAMAAGVSSPANVPGAALLNGIPLSLLGVASGGSSNGSGQVQAGTSSIADNGVLSQLEAAISAAASDGSQDSNWMDDLVSYAGGLGGGTGSAAGSTSTGAVLTGDLDAIQGVIQRVKAQVSSNLTAQGALPSQVSAAVNALTTSLTLNSLGAVAQQIASRTGNPDTFTVTSSVVTISSNATNTMASVTGQTESFSGVSGNLSLASTGAMGSVSEGSAWSANGTSTNSQGFGYRFAISESGPDGSAFAETSEVSAVASATSSNGAGGSSSATAALEDGSTVYESESGSGSANNSAMVLMSDWEANLESASTQNTTNSADASNATFAAQAQPAQTGTRTMSDLVNAAAHVLFKQALALLETMFGAGNSDAANEMGRGSLVNVYA